MKNIVSVIVLFLLILNTQNLKGQDFWEGIFVPDSIIITSVSVNENNDIYIGSSTGVYKYLLEENIWVHKGISNRIVNSIHISDNNILYAGTSMAPGVEGLFRSFDEGETWISILPDIGSYGNINIIQSHGDSIFVCLHMDSPQLLLSIDDCMSWDIIFTTDDTSEFITELIISEDDNSYLSLTGFFKETGGVYKYEKLTENWEYIGLMNHMVRSLALNENNDLLAGSWGGVDWYSSAGIFLLGENQNDWIEVLPNWQISDLIYLNTVIYAATSIPHGIIWSWDNGDHFEYINSGLPYGTYSNLFISNNHYLYTFNQESIAVSVNPVVGFDDIKSDKRLSRYSVYPNPATQIVNIKSLTNNSINGIVIRNVNGNNVFETNTRMLSSTEIYVSDFNSGIYFVEIIGQIQKEIHKIIIY